MKVHPYSKAVSWITRPRVMETATLETYTPELERMNFRPGSEQQVAGLSDVFPGTFTSYNDAVHGGFQGTMEEWLQQQSIPQTERPLAGAKGGRVYDTRKYFNRGQLVQPGLGRPGYGGEKSEKIRKIFDSFLAEGRTSYSTSDVLEKIGKNATYDEWGRTLQHVKKEKKYKNLKFKWRQAGYTVKPAEDIKTVINLIEEGKVLKEIKAATGFDDRFIRKVEANNNLKIVKTGRDKHKNVQKITDDIEKLAGNNKIKKLLKAEQYDEKLLKEVARVLKQKDVYANSRTLFKLGEYYDGSLESHYKVNLSKPTKNQAEIGKKIIGSSKSYRGHKAGYALEKLLYQHGARKVDTILNLPEGTFLKIQKEISKELVGDTGVDKVFGLTSSGKHAPVQAVLINPLPTTINVEKSGVDAFKSAYHDQLIEASKIENKAERVAKQKEILKKYRTTLKGWKNDPRYKNVEFPDFEIGKHPSKTIKNWNELGPAIQKQLIADYKATGISPKTTKARSIFQVAEEVGSQTWKNLDQSLKKNLIKLCGNKASGGRVGFQGAGAVAVGGVKCGQNRLREILQKGGGTTGEKNLVQKIMRGGGAMLKGLANPRQFFSLRALLGPEAMLFYAGIEGGMVSYDKLAKGIPWKEGISESMIGALTPWTTQEAQIEDMREKGMINTPAMKKWATGIENMAEIDRMYQGLEASQGMSTPTATGLRAIEKMKKNIEQKENEFMSWMGDNEISMQALMPGSGGEIEFQKALTERDAIEGATAPLRFFRGDVGAEELPPRITERIGPRKMGVVKEELKPLQQRFDLPETYEKVSTSETPLPAESFQYLKDYMRQEGLLKPRDDLPQGLIDYLQREEKWKQNLELPGMRGTQFNTGGRVGFAMGRRAFLGWLASVFGVIAGIKSGLIGFGKGKGKGTVAIKVGDKIIKSTEGMPDWFIPLVNRVTKEGTDVSQKLGTVKREIVHTKKLGEGKFADEVTVYQDMNTGNVRVVYESPHNMGEAPIQLEYRAGEVIESGKHAGKKTKSEFDAVESEPVGRAQGPDDYSIEWDGENVVGKVEDLTSDTSKLKQFATKRKLTHKDKIIAKKKKKAVQDIHKDSTDYISERQGEGDWDDYLPDIDDLD